MADGSTPFPVRAVVMTDENGLPLSANGQEIYKIKVGGEAFSPYLFEWHPRKGVVYVVKPKGSQFIGDIVSPEIWTHGAAWTAVAIWSRGYREGKEPGLHIAAE